MVVRTKRKTRYQRVKRGRVAKPRRLPARRRRNKPVKRIKKPPQEQPQPVPGQEFRFTRTYSISTAHTDDTSQSRSTAESSHGSSRKDGESSRCSVCGRPRKLRRSSEDENLEGQHESDTEHSKKGKEKESRRKKNKKERKFSAQKNTDLNTEEEIIQVGSRSKVLSPLFVATNNALSDEPTASQHNSPYAQITPEMIYEAMTSLTKWKQEVPLSPILEYIKINFPVNNDTQELAEELTFKMAIATITGMVTQEVRDSVMYWALATELIQQGFNKNHVTLFWKLYCDTMSPVRKKEFLDFQDAQERENLICEGWRRRSLCVCQPQPKCSSQCKCQPFPPPPCRYDPKQLPQNVGFSCRKRILEISKLIKLDKGSQSRNSHKSRGVKKRKIQFRGIRRRTSRSNQRRPRGILKPRQKVCKTRQKRVIRKIANPPLTYWNFPHKNSLQMLLKRRKRTQSFSNSSCSSRTSSQESLLSNVNSSHQINDLKRTQKNTRGICIRDSYNHIPVSYNHIPDCYNHISDSYNHTSKALPEPGGKKEVKNPFNDNNSLKSNSFQETMTQTRACNSKHFSISGTTNNLQNKGKLQTKTEGSTTGRSIQDTYKLTKAASKPKSLHIEIPYEGSENPLNAIFNVISGKKSVQVFKKATMWDSSQGEPQNIVCDSLLQKSLQETNRSWVCS